MSNGNINPLTGYFISALIFFLSLAVIVCHLQLYLKEDAEQTYCEKMTSFFSSSIKSNGKELQAMNLGPIDIASLPPKILKKLTIWDVIFFITAWISGIFFSKFSGVLVEQWSVSKKIDISCKK